MSQGSYPWPAGVKSEHDQFPGNPQPPITASRRSGSGDQQGPPFAYSGSYAQGDSQRRLQSRTGMRAHSSSTSSLSGAMDETQITVQPRTSVTPPSGLASWTSSPTSSMPPGGFLPDAGMNYIPTPITSASPSGAFGSYSQYSMLYNSPEGSPGVSSAFGDQFAFQQGRGQPSASSAAMVISPSATPAPTRHSQSPQDKDAQIQRLYQHIRDLESVVDHSKRRIRELEAEVSRGVYPGGLPSPLPTPAPPPTFDQEWRARTDARCKLYCSLNRAGNALCAWHDSRRERRAFPPRMAPAGYLNCGCSYEEALFEESLARHGVGSYLPGENVRMDPALRNPLLKLLKERYNYRDGDFERDPITGNWVDGEGAARWEQQVASGTAPSRRSRIESERR